MKNKTNYEIIDNFISDSDFETLEDYIMPYGHSTRPLTLHQLGNNVPWFFSLGPSVEETERAKKAENEITKYEKLEPYADKLFQHLFLL